MSDLTPADVKVETTGDGIMISFSTGNIVNQSASPLHFSSLFAVDAHQHRDEEEWWYHSETEAGGGSISMRWEAWVALADKILNMELERRIGGD